MYQIFMRPGTTEFGIMMLFDLGLYPKLSLGHPDRLMNPELPFPVSFIYGDRDWVRMIDDDAGRTICETNKHPSSKYHLVHTSDHNMHMDNPESFANIIINDVFQEQNLPEQVEIDPQSQIDFGNEFLEDIDEMSQHEENIED